MGDFVPFGGGDYFMLLGVLAVARGMDFLSTWVATPNLVLEGNPLVKKLGWKWALWLNAVFCLGFAAWPIPAIAISTTSLLVAARNFQHAWLMRTLGEEGYRHWLVARPHEARRSLVLFCLVAQSVLIAAVGGVLMLFCADQPLPLAIGLGIVSYAVAVAFFSLLSVWRLRHARE